MRSAGVDEAARDIIALVHTSRAREGIAAVQGGPGSAHVRKRVEAQVTARIEALLARREAEVREDERERCALIVENYQGPGAKSDGGLMVRVNAGAAIRASAGEGKR